MRKSIMEIIRKLDENSMVVYKSEKYGFIWAGRAKFMFSNFCYQVFDMIPKSVSTDSVGATVITVE